jgi:catechol 1,2-dioxygenase
MSTPVRNETLLLADILGLESLADTISSTLVSQGSSPTASAILGPFHAANAPHRAMHSSILVTPMPDCQPALLHGRILDARISTPIPSATLDVWLTAPDGTYSGQVPGAQDDGNLRGRFVTGADGTYAFYAVKPTAYPIPEDGPAGRVLRMLGRHAWRPAHVHFWVSELLVVMHPG